MYNIYNIAAIPTWFLPLSSRDYFSSLIQGEQSQAALQKCLLFFQKESL